MDKELKIGEQVPREYWNRFIHCASNIPIEVVHTWLGLIQTPELKKNTAIIVHKDEHNLLMLYKENQNYHLATRILGKNP